MELIHLLILSKVISDFFLKFLNFKNLRISTTSSDNNFHKETETVLVVSICANNGPIFS
jgi:hypothetical protein